MKKRFASIVCAMLAVCMLFSALPVSASTSDITTENVSGDTGTSLSGYAIKCDGETVGTCSLSSSRKTALLFPANRYVKGTSTCHVSDTTCGNRSYYEHYARVAYGETKSAINASISTQSFSTRTTYYQDITVGYTQERVQTGAIYCFTRISFKNTSGMQTHGNVGRYYVYSKA